MLLCCVGSPPCDDESVRHAVDPVFQGDRKQGRHPGDERLQLSQPITGGQHNDDGNRQLADVLLMLDAPVHRDESVETLGGGEGQQETVRGTCPSMS